ncbi:MAG: hypothetical protein Q8K70_08185 [Bacteroidota bacterium]|nr:hypothetical protein [Bacteroidota bacterium]
MKKTIFLSFIYSTALILSAQLQPTLKNKRGINILPEKGDYSFGISTDPFFNYLNSLTNSNTSLPKATFQNNQAFYGKYMISDNKAYRGGFRIGLYNNKLEKESNNLSPDAAPTDMVKESEIRKSNHFNFSFGVENRRGKTRLQGIWGLETFLNVSLNNTTKYEYGNKIEYLNTDTSRILHIKAGRQIGIGLRAFVGAEYFIAPKFSLGFDLGYGPQLNYNLRTKIKNETYNSINKEVTSKEVYSTRSRTFNLDTDEFNGNLRLIFYF